MKRVQVPSYPVSIFIATNSHGNAEAICSEYCDDVGLCVTVTATRFVYVNGGDPGYIIGLINYPRFPKEPAAIWAHAEALAERLCEGLWQQSYTIQAPDKTVWFSHRPEEQPA